MLLINVTKDQAAISFSKDEFWVIYSSIAQPISAFGWNDANYGCSKNEAGSLAKELRTVYDRAKMIKLIIPSQEDS